ncbi:MAG: TadE/TadG family type IV pilus assembly protein [Pseudomonadota bacterium]
MVEHFLTALRQKKWLSWFLIVPLRGLLRDQRGASAIVLAALIIPLMASTGAAVDVARAFMVKSRLVAAVDAAALAGGIAYYATDRNTQIQKFFNANFPPGYLNSAVGPLVIDPATVPTNTSLGSLTVTITARVAMPTVFMGLFGKNTINISAESEVTRRQQGLELVMVLDNTGSMTNGTRLQDLKDASNTLLGILYGPNEVNSKLRIGILPYTTQVNVGRLLRAEDPSYIDHRVTYFSTTLDVTNYTNLGPSEPYGWKGCVEARSTISTIDSDSDVNVLEANAHDISDVPPNTSNPATLFRPYLYPPFWLSFNGNVFNRYRRPSPAYFPWTAFSSSTSWPTANVFPDASGNLGRGPNAYCPSEAILPAPTNTKTQLTNFITNNLVAASHGTFSNTGMVWAWRMLSPGLPFPSPIQYGDDTYQKAIILMTDGYMQANNLNWAYGAYGLPYDGRLAGTTDSDDQIDALEMRLEKVCTAAKANDILVYTVAFALPAGNAPEKDLYRRCATTPQHFFDAVSGSDLARAFTEIALDLSNLHLSK